MRLMLVQYNTVTQHTRARTCVFGGQHLLVNVDESHATLAFNHQTRQIVPEHADHDHFRRTLHGTGAGERSMRVAEQLARRRSRWQNGSAAAATAAAVGKRWHDVGH